MKIVIIGGVAGGATAAARIRRLDEQAEIIILERSGFISYANCGLPYYIGGVIEHKDALTLQTPDSFWKRFRIDVRVKNEVTAICPEKKTVTVKKLDDQSIYEENYDKLILSPGAQSIRPQLPGIDSPRIFTLRTVEDAFAIDEYIKANHPRSAVVAGGGFIGLESAENLMQKGIKTTLVERLAQVMTPLDSDMACFVHAHLKSKGLDLCLGIPVTGFVQRSSSIATQLQSGEELVSDMVILAMGVRPETHLAKQAGLKLGNKDAIVVDQTMKTSDPDIFAVGDAVEIEHFVTQEKALISLAGPANKQARIAADNICSKHSVFRGAQGTSVIHLFGMTAAVTGINETVAQDLGLCYDKVITFSANHATYYPGANNMTVKTLFDPKDGKILGAQIIGFDGVDKRIDVLATAIRAGLSAYDLTQLELAYAPPYSSAKDPVNMAGYVIENMLEGAVKQYHWHDIQNLPQDGSVTFLDVRTRKEFAGGHIGGALNIPADELRLHLDELNPSNKTYVNCQSGLRSYIVCRILRQHGFDCYNLAGGYRYYDAIMREAEDAQAAYGCGIKIAMQPKDKA